LFNDRAPAVAKQHDLPLRTAVAIYLRLGKPWVELVREVMEALAGERLLVHTLARAKSGPPDWYLDERYVVYALRRAWMANDKLPIGEDRYDRLAQELIAADAKLKLGNVLADVMSSSAQIITICGSWKTACELAKIPARPKTVASPGHPTIQVQEHFYEMKERWPGKPELIEYANNELGISIPTEKSWNFTQLKTELVALRAQRSATRPRTAAPTRPSGAHPRSSQPCSKAPRATPPRRLLRRQGQRPPRVHRVPRPVRRPSRPPPEALRRTPSRPRLAEHRPGHRPRQVPGDARPGRRQAA
jgi:hypothetical protein